MNEFIEFFTDPLRLTLLVAGLVVVLGILIAGRRSAKAEAKLYQGHSRREFNFSPPPDLLVDEEIIVLPPKKKAATADADEAVPEEAPQVREFTPESQVQAPASGDRIKVDANTWSEEPAEISMNTFEYQQQAAPAESRSQAPAPAGKQTPDAVEQKPAGQQESAVPAEPKPAPERFIVFYIVPGSKETFTGKELTQVANRLGLAYGKHGVFHFPADSAREGDSQFCLVNMTPEGNFDRESLPTLETRGVSLILRLSENTKDGLALFSNMLAIAQGMARQLGGRILDQTRVPLTPDIVTHLRGDIAKFHTQLNQRTPVTEV